MFLIKFLTSLKNLNVKKKISIGQFYFGNRSKIYPAILNSPIIFQFFSYKLNNIYIKLFEVFWSFVLANGILQKEYLVGILMMHLKQSVTKKPKDM